MKQKSIEITPLRSISLGNLERPYKNIKKIEKKQSQFHHSILKNQHKKVITGPNSEKTNVIKAIGIYSITDRILGDSYFSTVYFGLNNATKWNVAIKIIRKNGVQRNLNAIENEVNLLNQMRDSKRIVKLENYFYDQYDNFYMIFEYAEFNLLEYYNANVEVFASERNVFLFFYKILLALLELHNAGISHRDLKLENIFLFKKTTSESWSVKIGDLGLSTVCDKNKKLSEFCGSPIYSAPEVNSGIPYIGFKYDIWSAGIILYFLQYGVFPFNVFKHEVDTCTHDTEDIVRQKIISRLYQKIQNDGFAVDLEKNASDDFKTLVIWMLKKNPEDRPFVEEIFSHPWIINWKNHVKMM